jgi:TATA-box binding protein (TBP) (component of TFIID and TFIIIB)
MEVGIDMNILFQRIRTASKNHLQLQRDHYQANPGDPTIQNNVTIATVAGSISVTDLLKSLPNAKAEIARFPSVVARIMALGTKFSFLIFGAGSLVQNGAKTEEHALFAIHTFTTHLRKIGILGKSHYFTSINVENRVFSGNTAVLVDGQMQKTGVDIACLHRDLGSSSTYDPFVFPGVTYIIPDEAFWQEEDGEREDNMALCDFGGGTHALKNEYHKKEALKLRHREEKRKSSRHLLLHPSDEDSTPHPSSSLFPPPSSPTVDKEDSKKDDENLKESSSDDDDDMDGGSSGERVFPSALLRTRRANPIMRSSKTSAEIFDTGFFNLVGIQSRFAANQVYVHLIKLLSKYKDNTIFGIKNSKSKTQFRTDAYFRYILGSNQTNVAPVAMRGMLQVIHAMIEEGPDAPIVCTPSVYAGGGLSTLGVPVILEPSLVEMEDGLPSSKRKKCNSPTRDPLTPTSIRQGFARDSFTDDEPPRKRQRINGPATMQDKGMPLVIVCDPAVPPPPPPPAVEIESEWRRRPEQKVRSRW